MERWPAREHLLRRLSNVPPDEVFTTIVTYEDKHAAGWHSARARTAAQRVEAYHKLQRQLDLYWGSGARVDLEVGISAGDLNDCSKER